MKSVNDASAVRLTMVLNLMHWFLIADSFPLNLVKEVELVLRIIPRRTDLVNARTLFRAVLGYYQATSENGPDRSE